MISSKRGNVYESLFNFCPGLSGFDITIAGKYQQKIDTYHKKIAPSFGSGEGGSIILSKWIHRSSPLRVLTRRYIPSEKHFCHTRQRWFEPSRHNQWCMNGVPRYRYHGHYQNICKLYKYITVTIK